jgi:hypothetical protein
MSGGPEQWLQLRQQDGQLRLLYHDLQHHLQHQKQHGLDREEQAYDDRQETVWVELYIGCRCMICAGWGRWG